MRMVQGCDPCVCILELCTVTATSGHATQDSIHRDDTVQLLSGHVLQTKAAFMSLRTSHESWVSFIHTCWRCHASVGSDYSLVCLESLRTLFNPCVFSFFVSFHCAHLGQIAPTGISKHCKNKKLHENKIYCIYLWLISKQGMVNVCLIPLLDHV